MSDPITTAREQAARELATREIACWEGEYSPPPDEYANVLAQTKRELLAPDGPLSPLCAAYEAQLAEVTRERDALARDLRFVEKRQAVRAAHEFMRELACGDAAVSAAAERAYDDYGGMLRERRLDTAWGPSDVAEACGLTADALCAVEQCRRPPFDDDTTRRLCAWLGCDPQPLLDAAARAEEVLRG